MKLVSSLRRPAARASATFVLAGLLAVALGAFAVSARGAVYDFALGDAGNRTMRMSVPDGLRVVRGLLIWGNGSNYDARAVATDPEMVAFAESMGFAVIATSMWTNFAYGYTPSEYSGFEYGLQRFAEMSGHPEITRAPWLPIGQSNGGNMSYSLNVLHPEKVIAMAMNKGWGPNDPRPAPAALRTPGLLLAGEIDVDVSRTVNHDLFTTNRPRGALWAWAEEQMANHNTGDTFELILPFVEEICRLRYPAHLTPQSGAVNLLNVSETSGWLTDPDSYQTGLATIASHADYPKAVTAAGWLPTRRMAYIFRAFASHSLARYEVNLSTGHGPVDWGTRATYAIGEPIAAWSAIEFYDGDTLLKTITPADVVPLTVDTILNHPGYAVLHAFIRFADGSRQTTMPRRVFVRAPVAGAVAGATTVAPGGATVLTAATPTVAGATYQWQIDPGGGWENLSNGTLSPLVGASCTGAGTASLTLAAIPAALNAARFRCVYSGASFSTAVTLTVAATPTVSVVQGAAGQSVEAGARVTLAVQSPESNLRYQWFRNGVSVTDATAATWSFTAGAADAGEYAVVATAANGLSTTVNLGSLAVTSASRLVNLAARANVRTGDDILIAGFVTAGPEACARKAVLLRGVGPTLGQPPFNVPGALAESRLRLSDHAGASLDMNTAWEASLAPTFARLGAFALPVGSRDAALLEAVPVGVYSASLTSATNAAGVGLLEIYDADGTAPANRLVNLSARANVGAGANILIGGFVINGTTSATVLVRAVGLGLRQFLPTTLLQPVLTVVDAKGRMIARNRSWLEPVTRGDSPVVASVQSARTRTMAEVGAFLLPEPQTNGYQAGWDSAVLLTLPPGAYTAGVSSADGTGGVALVEIYEVR